jgi:hypothetical protein
MLSRLSGLHRREGDDVPAPPENELDQEAQAALGRVKLDLLTAEPSIITPFTNMNSTVRWKVSLPDGFDDVTVELELEGMPIPTSGQFSVAPQTTQSYRLTAHARRYSKVLGMVTVEIDLGECKIHSDDSFIFAITQTIKYQIETDPAGLRFRAPIPPQPPFPPLVTITGDRMVIALRLTKQVSNFPDPAINIDASFGLEVDPIPRTGRGSVLAGVTPAGSERLELVPANKVVSADVSVPWWAWGIPGAQIPLVIAINAAQDKAEKSANNMIHEIVGTLNDWFSLQQDIQPGWAWDKHDAGFYVNPQGSQRFWIRFCPAPSGPSVLS